MYFLIFLVQYCCILKLPPMLWNTISILDFFIVLFYSLSLSAHNSNNNSCHYYCCTITPTAMTTTSTIISINNAIKS